MWLQRDDGDSHLLQQFTGDVRSGRRGPGIDNVRRSDDFDCFGDHTYFHLQWNVDRLTERHCHILTLNSPEPLKLRSNGISARE
jgi:hypothetical protein